MRRLKRRMYALTAVVIGALAVMSACPLTDEELARSITRGDPERGKDAMRRYGCTSCHSVSDVPGARGTVGPALDGVALRSFLAGHVENTPANLEAWIMHPQAIVPGSAMPEMNVSASDARDIAAFLYTRR